MSAELGSAPALSEPAHVPGAGWWAVGCVALHLGLAFLLFDPSLFTGADAGHYMVLGEALRSGEGYRDIHLPGSPLHAKYPPGYPVLLAVLGWFGGLQLLKLASLAMTSGAVALTFALGRRHFGDATALLAAAAVAVSPVTLQYSHLVLSEALFTALILIGLWSWRPQGPLLLPVLLAAAAFMTRTAGLPLLLAFAVYAGLERSRSALLACAAATVACMVGWGVYQRVAAPAYPGYVQQLLLLDPYEPGLGTVGVADLAARTAGNFWRYLSAELPSSFGMPRGLPSETPAGTVLVGILASALVLAGWLREATRGLTPATLFVVFYGGLLLLWPPVWTDRRFLLPLLPLVALYAFDGARWIARRDRPRYAAAGTVLLALLLLAPSVDSAARLAPERFECRARVRAGGSCDLPEYAAFYAAAEWARENTPPEAVIANRSPPIFYLLSSRQGDLYPFSRDPETVMEGLEKMGATHVLVDQLSMTTALYLLPAIEAYPDRFQLVYVVGDPPLAGLFRLTGPPRTALRDRVPR